MIPIRTTAAAFSFARSPKAPARSGRTTNPLVVQMNDFFAHLEDAELDRLLDLFNRFNDVMAREITALKNRREGRG